MISKLGPTHETFEGLGGSTGKMEKDYRGLWIGTLT